MRIGRLFGIDITVHVSWLFIFALVAWTLSSDLGPLGRVNLGAGQRTLLGVVTALLFFGSVLLHELAHSLVARSRGIPIKGITLMIFGGVSSFEREPASAPSEAWIAFVGPLMSLILSLMFFAAASAIGASTPLGEALSYLGVANAILAAFNLLPAFPLDGGRVLHAIVWRATGDRAKATAIAVNIGRVLAWAMIVWGILQTFQFGFGGGLWTTFIGWFLLQAGSAEAFQAKLTNALQGHAVSELVTKPAGTVQANATVAQGITALLQTGQSALPVLLDERLVGIITVRDVARSAQPDREYVTAIMTRIEGMESIDPAESAIGALHALARSGTGMLPVIDKAGDLAGFVTSEGIMRWLSFERERALHTVHSERPV